MKTTSKALRAALTTLLLLSVTMVRAQLASRYYRFLNTETGRYLTVTNDNLGYSLDAAFSALVTVKGFDNVVSSPASVIYVRNAGQGQYDVVAQGADSYELTTFHFNMSSKGNNVYNAYARYLTQTYYLGDNVSEGKTRSQADINGTAIDWYVLPLTTADGQYFGFTPEVQDRSDSRYTTCYAAFPLQPYDAGVKAYYVCAIKGTYAVVDEISGTIPALTPVIIKCTSRTPNGNRATIPDNSPTAITQNVLKGALFEKTNGLNPQYTPYDENTMRILGLTAQGKIGFVKSLSLYRVKANKAYLPVEPGSPDELTIISRADYEKQFGPIGDELPGDVNGDNKIDVGDIMAVINYMAGQTAGITLKTADVNGDSKVDVGDIMAIINIMANQ